MHHQDRYVQLVGELAGRLRQVREIPAPSPSPAPPPAPTPLPPALDNARGAKEVRSILNQQVIMNISKCPHSQVQLLYNKIEVFYF